MWWRDEPVPQLRPPPTAPELGGALRDGQTLRVQLQFNMNTGAGPTPLVDVTLLDGERAVQRWTGLVMRSEPLR